jgi:hypothetical protein
VQELRQLNNFNGIYAIVNALRSPAIARLQRTLADLDAESAAALKSFDELFHASGNYKNYHKLIGAIEAPAIPCLYV